ncbi:MAG TPA: hypothetical protein VE758_10555 [Chthoniobacterales bacterium]|nr:hypothetical protein [Chthoniobacterales bacterium]
MRRNTSIFLTLLALIIAGRADLLDQVNDALSIRDPKNSFQLQLSGLLDVEGYFIDQRPPGLINSDDKFLFNPRLSIFVDAQWTPHFYFFAQTRVDRGFDPSDRGAQIRLDEYLLRYTPLDNTAMNLQIGKFATVTGNFVLRHDSWKNPFINAPLPYENITTISDTEAPSSRRDFASRRFETDEQYERLPLIWGPNYTTGAAVLGTIEKFDYAFEIKNAAISSRPESWQPSETGWSNPHFAGRIGFRPNESWNFGVSGSVGPYMTPDARDTLPRGKNIDNYNQYVLEQDASFAWRHLQVWAEVFEARFEVPTVGDADTLSYYLEAKYKLTPQLFAATRWNQQFYSDVPAGGGREQPWGNDIWRVDAALGYRFTNYLQAKIQYSFSHQDAPLQQGEQLIAGQLTIKF